MGRGRGASGWAARRHPQSGEAAPARRETHLVKLRLMLRASWHTLSLPQFFSKGSCKETGPDETGWEAMTKRFHGDMEQQNKMWKGNKMASVPPGPAGPAPGLTEAVKRV